MTQDRRVRKSKQAIFQAFLDLLNEKGYDKLTVQEIIDRADVGRSTFYAHYESKDFLLEELCQDLFHHLFKEGEVLDLKAYLSHLFSHFKRNQDKVTSLLLSRNDYFLRMLMAELRHDVCPRIYQGMSDKKKQVNQAYLDHMICTAFIESLTWWLREGSQLTEEEMIDQLLLYYGIDEETL
ncbi:TetR/AcrR family transcriptional regulator [Streptococcus loxodontisalivarius]|uniref:AcrR family transcriptional regulator n=1 Tax=Streptococcus loxodontisalivarius TaxID=1349415 RepID=A0ABS2PTN7_9STRE|nr:TetR/AcrR family transcriptional regulator [Streptococcus loxodontisalivarius]MBM7643394.1 AcrR family transcriptional regulator [Streptococcus loxodontisalivarius]